MPPINFDIKKLLADIKDVLLAAVVVDTPVIVDAVTSYVSNAESRLTSLIENMYHGGSAKFLLDRLAEEKDIMLTQLLSFEVMGKQIAQTVINNAQNIILQAVNDVLPADVTATKE